MSALQLSNNQLDSIAMDVSKIINLSSNIGDIGIGTSYANNQLRNPLQDQFPLLNWLMNTSSSMMMRNANRQGLAAIQKDATTGQWMITAPYAVATTAPADTTGACCWVPLDITSCGASVPLKLLCLKDCDDLMNNLVNSGRTAGTNDLTGYFLKPGETVKAARTRMAKQSMAFFTAYNIILGVSNSGTTVLKPFHGLLEIMEDTSVIKIIGTNILSAFDALGCRINVLGGNNYVIAVHPLVNAAIASVVVPGKFNQLPDGWTKGPNNELTYNGIRFIPDKLVPVDIATGLGEAWLLDGDTTGVFMGTDLVPTDSFVRSGFTSTDDPTKGCASECDFYYNYGAVMNNDTNRLAMITDIPLSKNCSALVLQGLDAVIKPNTLVPMT